VAAIQKKCSGWLTPSERQHHQKLKTPKLQHEYLAARALCRITLSRYTRVDPADWKFTTGLNGKPKIAGPAGFASLRFNLTHTEGLIICLISRAGEVGIDAEETSREVDISQVTKHFFSKIERASLEQFPPERRAIRFFEQWVLKEAYLKGKGQGLMREPNRFTIEMDAKGKPLPKGLWQFSIHRSGPHHVAATAIRPRRGIGALPVKWFTSQGLLEAGIPIE
jgi:4'-phosphopantetheinyl transferase